MTAHGGMERLSAVAPGVLSTPVIQVGTTVLLGYDRGRLARVLGVR